MIHTMLDCYSAGETKLDDMKFIDDLLFTVSQNLNLETVMPPFLCPYYYGKNSEDVGISAFLFVKGGHITIHTFSKRQCYFVDVLSTDYHDSKKLRSIFSKNLNYENDNLLRIDRRFSKRNIETLENYNLQKNNDDFGRHLLSNIVLKTDFSMENMFDLLDGLPQKIDMTQISRPYIVKSGKPDSLYYSGIVLIAQSHIAFHYIKETKELYFDIFSCSDFDINKTTAELESFFNSAVLSQTIIRGSKHESEIMNQMTRSKKFGSWRENIK